MSEFPIYVEQGVSPIAIEFSKIAALRYPFAGRCGVTDSKITFITDVGDTETKDFDLAIEVSYIIDDWETVIITGSREKGSGAAWAATEANKFISFLSQFTADDSPSDPAAETNGYSNVS